MTPKHDNGTDGAHESMESKRWGEKSVKTVGLNLKQTSNPFFPPCYIILTLLYLQSKEGAQLAARYWNIWKKLHQLYRVLHIFPQSAFKQWKDTEHQKEARNVFSLLVCV